MVSWVKKNFTILLSVDGAFYKNFSEEAEWELVLWEMQDRQANDSKIVSDKLKKILIWLNRVLVAAHRGFDLNSLWHVGSFSLQHANSLLWHLGSSSPTRDRTWAPYNGSLESYLLSHQGSPSITTSKFLLISIQLQFLFFTCSVITLILSSLLIWGKEIWVDSIYTKRLLLDTRTFWPNGC